VYSEVRGTSINQHVRPQPKRWLVLFNCRLDTENQWALYNVAPVLGLKCTGTLGLCPDGFALGAAGMP
jgi:hypothetical protein